jgi:hypothetical protein
MDSTSLFEQQRERAIALRRAGLSRREIKEILGFTSNTQLNEALRGEPPPAWTLRPRAKDELRAKARELREQGLAYHQIVAELGVSKSSVSLWVRDLPRPQRLSNEEARPQSCRTSQVPNPPNAPGRGFEPRLRAPKAPVMPLDHPGMSLANSTGIGPARSLSGSRTRCR